MLRIIPPRWLRAEVGPLLAVLLVLAGALVAFGQYAQLRLDRQRMETARYLAEFEHGPVAVAWRCLSERWWAEWPRQEALLTSIATAPPDAALEIYRRFVLETVDEHRLDEPVITVFRYFRRLGLCVRMGSCDQATAAAHLGDLAWRFRNQHYLFLSEHLTEHEVDQVFELLAPAPRLAQLIPQDPLAP
jgi:hypothetical protein